MALSKSIISIDSFISLAAIRAASLHTFITSAPTKVHTYSYSNDMVVNTVVSIMFKGVLIFMNFVAWVVEEMQCPQISTFIRPLITEIQNPQNLDFTKLFTFIKPQNNALEGVFKMFERICGPVVTRWTVNQEARGSILRSGTLKFLKYYS